MPDQETYRAARELIADSLGGFLPEIILALTVCVLFLHDIVVKGRYPKRTATLALVGLGLTALSLLSTWPGAEGGELFGWLGANGEQKGMLAHDGFGWFFKMLILLGTAVVVPMCLSYPAFQNRNMGEFYALLIGSTLGMFLMAGATNLLMIFLGIEFASMGSYLLTAFVKNDRKGSEAGLKYVIYGSVASGVMIYGLSLVYGMTGSLWLGDLAQQLIAGNLSEVGLVTAGVLVFGGFAYKMAAFPMHFWCPDVYEGAPTPVTAYLSVASKAAGFAVFVRFLMGFGEAFTVNIDVSGALESLSVGWRELVAATAALSMTVGNLAALWQTNVKRMLAYSSVAHAGYLLMGVAALDPAVAGGEQFGPLAYYFIAYFVMNLGAFYVINLLQAKEGSVSVEGYRNLGFRAPLLSACLVVFLFSLLGVPPTGGFVGKMQLFMAVIDGGLVWLAVVAGINTAISAYYYFKIVKSMYLERKEDEAIQPMKPGYLDMTVIGGFAVLVLWLGIFFSGATEFSQQFPI